MLCRNHGAGIAGVVIAVSEASAGHWATFPQAAALAGLSSRVILGWIPGPRCLLRRVAEGHPLGCCSPILRVPSAAPMFSFWSSERGGPGEKAGNCGAHLGPPPPAPWAEFCRLSTSCCLWSFSRPLGCPSLGWRSDSWAGRVRGRAVLWPSIAPLSTTVPVPSDPLCSYATLLLEGSALPTRVSPLGGRES